MKLINLNTKIYKFDRINEFMNEFNVQNKDLIFTSKRVYNKFFKERNINSYFLFKDNYNFNEPNNEAIDKMLFDIKEFDYSRVIAIGGGSIIDVAKILALNNVKNSKKLFKGEIDVVRDKGLIVIPTTCGTGSEVTNISIIEIRDEAIKLGLANDEIYPDYAILIPELCIDMPYKFFMYSSIDALIHSIESYISPKNSHYTEIFSLRAIEIIIEGYKLIAEKGQEYRKNIIEQFLIASNYAGIAFGNTGVGAVHALSYPLGGKYNVPHGEANYQFLIDVLDFYKSKKPDGKINDLVMLISKILDVNEENVLSELRNLLDKLIDTKKLHEYGMTKGEITEFPELIIKTQQRLLKNNYVPMCKQDMINIYKNLY